MTPRRYHEIKAARCWLLATILAAAAYLASVSPNWWSFVPVVGVGAFLNLVAACGHDSLAEKDCRTTNGCGSRHEL